jgi:hypothetical protein
MICSSVRKQIPLAVGGDLDAEDQRIFDEHLRSCLSCYREYRDYQDVLAKLDPIRAPEPVAAPAGLAEAILAEVRAGTQGPLAPHPMPLWARSAFLPRVVLPLAAALLVFTIAGMHFLDGGKSSRPQAIPGGMFGDPPTTMVINPTTPAAGDGPVDTLVIPEVLPGSLRFVGPAPFYQQEPLPAARVRNVSDTSDF